MELLQPLLTKCADAFSALNEEQQDEFRSDVNDFVRMYRFLVNTKLELYNKLTEDKANATLKRLWFNELYDAKMRGLKGK